MTDQQPPAPSLPERTYHPDHSSSQQWSAENRQREAREQARGQPAMGGVGRGGPSYRTVLPPQALQHQAGIQPSTPVPSSSIFQQTFVTRAAQMAQNTVPGSLQLMILMATASGRGILPIGMARGHQTPAIPMDTSRPMTPGGLQQMQTSTPLTGSILDLPRQLAIPPPQPPPARVVLNSDTGNITYYGSDMSAALLLQQMQQAGWPRSGHDTYGTQ